MYSVYRVPLYRCSDTITLSARSSRDDAPGGVQPTGTECRQTEAGLVKSWSCTSCAFIPISLRPFPPLAKGGLGGGGPGTTSHKVFPCSLPLSPFASLSRNEKNRSRFPRLPHHPPPPPPSQGGESDRSLATSFHRAQQKHASRNRPSSSVNTNFSPAHGQGLL